MIPLLLVISLIPAADGLSKANPLYQQLRDKGVPVSKTNWAKLPAPEMPDGLTADEQKKLLEKLLGNDFDYDVFVDNSVNAPVFFMPLQPIEKSDPQAPAYLMNVYFIVHGDINKIVERKGFKDSGDADQGKAEGKELSPAELKAKNITIAPESAKSEGYGYAVINVMDRVKLEVTGHAYTSKQDDSIVVASEIAQEFNQDKTYPNQWRPLKEEKEPLLYTGAGYYLKLTPLKGIPGASFVECHAVFTEPVGWFKGENLLRSKLPAVITNRVRKFRAELKKSN